MSAILTVITDKTYYIANGIGNVQQIFLIVIFIEHYWQNIFFPEILLLFDNFLVVNQDSSLFLWLIDWNEYWQTDVFSCLEKYLHNLANIIQNTK